MERRKYNLISCAVICSIGVVLVGLMWGGYLFRAVFYLMSLLPEGDLGLLAHPTKDEFIEVSITFDGGEVLLAKRGDYRVFVLEGTRFPKELVLELIETGEQIELVPLPSDMYVYGPDLVYKDPIFAFHIDQPGVYKIRAVGQDRSCALTIVPHYIAQNRLRFFICLSIPLAVVIIVGILKYWPDIQEARKQKRERIDKKREKWEKLK